MGAEGQKLLLKSREYEAEFFTTFGKFASKNIHVHLSNAFDILKTYENYHLT